MQQILFQQGGVGSNDGQPLLGVSPSDQIQPLLQALPSQPKVQNVTPALHPQWLVSPVVTGAEIGTILGRVKPNAPSLPDQERQTDDVTTNRQVGN